MAVPLTPTALWVSRSGVRRLRLTWAGGFTVSPFRSEAKPPVSTVRLPSFRSRSAALRSRV